MTNTVAKNANTHNSSFQWTILNSPCALEGICPPDSHCYLQQLLACTRLVYNADWLRFSLDFWSETRIELQFCVKPYQICFVLFLCYIFFSFSFYCCGRDVLLHIYYSRTTFSFLNAHDNQNIKNTPGIKPLGWVLILPNRHAIWGVSLRTFFLFAFWRCNSNCQILSSHNEPCPFKKFNTLTRVSRNDFHFNA